MVDKVRIFDQVCGTGKTSKIMGLLASQSRPILYITPLLSECHRVSGTLAEKVGEESVWAVDERGEFIIDPTHSLAVKEFKHPHTRNSRGSKLESLIHLVEHKHNIVSTHVLFKMLTPDVLYAIKQAGYLLVCDEAISVYEQYEIAYHGESNTNDNIIALIANNFIQVEDDGKLTWNYSEFPMTEDTFYEECASLCDMGQLYLINEKAVFMELSANTFQSFDEIWFATYMFEYSHLCSFLKIHGIGYSIEYGTSKPSDYQHLITLVEDKKLNNVGNTFTALSSGNLKLKDTKDVLSRNLHNFLTNKTKSCASERIWTTTKTSKHAVGGARYRVQFVPIGTKATNDYMKVRTAAYLYNGFSNPMLKHMLRNREGDFNEDMWALSEMIQWVWRTRIRKFETIDLYIPSSRMRELFKRWLNDEFI